jgi:hypothetical protein
MPCQNLAGIEAITVYWVKLGSKMEIPAKYWYFCR